ncbi:sodium:proton antiporter [bacterium CG17_big_fil_post_rev_8_21_14_2_50_64_8]|nr:MAG: sodium:proton antiporter [bacterium CG17_big_fil_post_rev_8_21_14_2_50_64_8]PJA76438.1 MAG: sodium:proton antiporter [bacterium CG_4_9_14_3_um_filter_65_15]
MVPVPRPDHPILRILLLTLVAGLLVFAAGSAIAQDHGAATQQQADHAVAQDAEHADGHHADPVGMLPLWTAIPFVGILLSIAVFPLIAPHFWHKHFPKVSAAWALAFALPFLIWNAKVAFGSILHIYLLDYIPFIILLWGLFTISGGIYVGGSLAGTPRVNLALLLIGTFMASLIGTTGAAMVLIRPLLRANQWRRNKVHLIVFFIFLVANIGGSLTPLGDPPLFLGFLHGVPFFWVTTGLLTEMLLTSGIILIIFFILDTVMYRREEHKPDQASGKVKIEGLHNGLFLLGVMGAVIMSGSVKMGTVTVYTAGAHPVTVPVENWVKDVLILLMGILSLRTTARTLREKNEFSWFPIKEVAYLFAGIFMTIIPALAILKAGHEGALAGLTNAIHGPVRYFWATGLLSSFLDNAPTYLTFFNSALGSLGIPESQVHALLSAGGSLHNPEFVKDLAAISSGAVFMGAMTYIGNAPNFMVKSIAEEAGIPMPSFFGYLLKWSMPVLIPVFVIVTFVFFW